MKKLITIINLLLLIVLVSGCSNNRLKSISESIELDVSNCKIEKDIDTHGGFLGDGEQFTKITCSSIDNVSSNWKKLPLTEPISKAIELIQCVGDGCKNVYERYDMPHVTNGYYFFLDRHSESINKYDDTIINERSSWNFTLAILDNDTNTIYYYELDT